ncbi:MULTISPECIES: transglycosylase domain-containing protein [Hallella]|uniref:Transglycosylase domain-containing protein n=1 Tax=Hallella faecis TaxID=2841596 RepID=A0ABV1FSK2_9BACT|nr:MULTISPECIES: transglycosylase domain-containing protein [Hallella]MBS7399186.1 transglycosylase domain-containing protein [Prevotella sp.]MBU0290632.1 transglycosylase domain-containing protein [Hallella faecis]MCI7433340.1 transglycosylase domain-containing protein [Prevotella sp.]MDR3844375.1 transglycosylase domain-containing protein [Hallella sp.]MDY5925266.1 transglycosylase domain-containing protein [Hallella sp.]
MRKKFIHILWLVLGLLVGTTTLLFFLIWFGVVGYSPDIENLQNPISKSASLVYSEDGKVLGTYNADKANRIPVSFSKLSPHLVHALVATEDVRFYEHSGIDFIALGRAIVKRGLLGHESAGGGSTITQQLAKQLYSAPASSSVERMLQKPIEWVTAIKLERNFTKEEIIALYLNYFDFLHGAVGIKTAANTYFNKEPKDLTVNEAALLIGLCKNPSLFNPVRYPERCKERRNVVLAQMVKAGYLSQAEGREYGAQPIELHFHRADHKDGVAVYFREYLRQYMMMERPERKNYPSWNYRQFVIDSIAFATDPLCGWCKKNTKKDGTFYNIYTDGLKIHTTIDYKMQQYAEESVYGHVARYLQPIFNKENKAKPNAPFTEDLTPAQVKQIMNRAVRQSERYRVMQESGCSAEEIERSFRTPVDMTVFTYHGDIDTVMTPLDSIRYYKSFLRAGFLSMDAHNGHVKAYVGGIDFEHFQYDMVMGGRRQVGSTIKPFLYSLAMENGASPCDRAPNVQQTYMVGGKPWTPRNANRRRYGQMVTLKWGLAQSNNWISAYLMSRLNPRQFVNILHKFGINNPDIYPSMSLCLGPCEVSVGEMVSAYTTFANNGIRIAPMFVTKIEDNEGNVVAEFQPRMNEVISSASAYKMLVELMAVVDEGTAGRLRFRYHIPGEIGGKTGTTNRNSDAWFMGFTPQLVSGVWVGGEDRDIHFDNMRMGQGATMALPIWAYFMKKVYRDQSLPYDSTAVFDVPEDFNPCGHEDMTTEPNEIDEVYE